MVTLYGIRNCDTVRKACCWLEGHGVEYRFHDIRADGLSKAVLQGWTRELGWEKLLNRRGTTWRRLPVSERNRIDESAAMKLMLENPAIIKRPVLAVGGTLQLGFSEDGYRQLFP
jgi:Spx/MgsR family transcriptional regulator